MDCATVADGKLDEFIELPDKQTEMSGKLSKVRADPFPVILAMVAWIALQFFVGCSEDRSRSNDDMKQQAETAIRDAGGADALEKKAKFILSNFQVGSDWETNCPAITKLDSLLNPPVKDSWVVVDEKNLPALPAHVVVRFGSHAHYEYVWIFDPAHVPLEKIEGVEHLSGAVYLSERNL